MPTMHQSPSGAGPLPGGINRHNPVALIDSCSETCGPSEVRHERDVFGVTSAGGWGLLLSAGHTLPPGGGSAKLYTNKRVMMSQLLSPK